MAQAKGLLDVRQQQPVKQRSFLQRHRIAAICVVLPISLLLLWIRAWPWAHTPSRSAAVSQSHGFSNDQCPQVAPLLPRSTSKKLSAMDEFLQSGDFKNESIARLSHAVQIPTMSFDDMGAIGEDKRWDVFYDFAAFLNKTFPLIHQKLELDFVNVHGLVYTWKGSNPDLAPTLLMAHQDVVPVPESTIDSWTHPPFEGVFDGKFIWGRGASDCKNQLIATMEAVELLLAADYKPQRTVILSFGFDEEVSGPQGAGHLAPYLLSKYGKYAMSVIVDEGAGTSSIWGSTFAMPGVAEKGYVDVEIVVRMPGGHSSIPPPHAGIGVMSELITLIEASPYEPHLSDDNPYLALLKCGARYSPDFPDKLKELLPQHSNTCHAKKDRLALEAAKAGLATKYLMTTSLAVDVIQGGLKVNALPERTTAIVNHRVNVGESPANVRAKITKLAETVANKHNLTLHAFDDAEETPSSITLTARPTQLEPAPVTPTSVDPLSAYSILSGTTRALYGENVLLAPGIMTGNTDTRYYWDLSRNIFRYGPGWDSTEEGLGKIHTVDERVSVKAHVSAAQWFSLFIRNNDESGLP